MTQWYYTHYTIINRCDCQPCLRRIYEYEYEYSDGGPSADLELLPMIPIRHWKLTTMSPRIRAVP